MGDQCVDWLLNMQWTWTGISLGKIIVSTVTMKFAIETVLFEAATPA